MQFPYGIAFLFSSSEKKSVRHSPHFPPFHSNCLPRLIPVPRLLLGPCAAQAYY